MASNDKLHITTLGRYHTERNGALLPPLASRKADALLVYLAATRRTYAREVLAELLWDNRSQGAALGNLRVLLASLRKHLRPFVHINRYEVGFNLESNYRLDVTELEKGLAQIERHAAPNSITPDRVYPLEAGELEEAARALDLYRGDFMQGFHVRDCSGFDEWVTLEQARLRQRVAQAHLHLGAIYWAHGKAQAALEQSRRLLALDPLHEAGIRQLLLASARTGQRGAALVHYETWRERLAAELGAAPTAETVAVYRQVRGGTRGEATQRETVVEISMAADARQDERNGTSDDDIPEVALLLGRDVELARLERMMGSADTPGQSNSAVSPAARLIAIVGTGGIGKSTLAASAARRYTPGFDAVVWVSLLNSPPLDDLLEMLFLRLGLVQRGARPGLVQGRLDQLLEYFRQQRCLVVLDNLESLLESDSSAGRFRPDYGEYALLLRCVAEREHRSCVLLTSREEPSEIRRLRRDHAQVQTLTLGGLNERTGAALLDPGSTGQAANAEAAQLAARYSGNPLALKLAAQTIRELYDGDLAAFLKETTIIFSDIRDVLAGQFERLSPEEQEVLTWLAVEREPVSLEVLRGDLAQPGAKRALPQTLHALQRRSLLERHKGGFFLPNVLVEYLTERVIEQACAELETGDLRLLESHALLKATAYEFVRQSQERLLALPIVDALRRRYGLTRAENLMRERLAGLRERGAGGYAAGNLLNLLTQMGANLRGVQCADLNVWQAFLSATELPEVNFARADLTGSVFAHAFRAVNALAFSADGKLVAAGSGDGAVYLWEVATGRLAHIYRTNARAVRAVAITPGGHAAENEQAWLACGGDDGVVYLWDTRIQSSEDAPLHVLTGHSGWVETVAFDPEGRLLAAGGRDRSVRIWDLSNCECIRILLGHTESVQSVVFLPGNRKLLASVSHDCSMRVWDWESGRLLQEFSGHEASIESVAARSSDGLLATGSYDRTIRLWDLEQGRCVQVLRGHDDIVQSVAFNNTGRVLVSGGRDRTVRLWSLAPDHGKVPHGTSRETETRVLHGHVNEVKTVTFVPPGEDGLPQSEIIASSGNDQTIRLWDAESGRLLRTLHGRSGWLLSLAFDAVGRRLASAGDDHVVRLWQLDDAGASAPQLLYGHEGWVKSVAFSPDGKLLASGGDDRTVRLWNVEEQEPSGRGGGRRTALRVLRGHEDRTETVAFSPDGKLLASGSDDHTVRLWDMRGTPKGTPLAAGHLLTGHEGWIEWIEFSPNGRWLATASADRTVRLWSVASLWAGQGAGEAESAGTVRVLRGHESWVEAIAFSPDGRLLASGSFDQRVQVWDIESGEIVRTLRGHTAPVRSLAFSPDGSTIASGGRDQAINLWDLQTGSVRRIDNAHAHTVSALLYIPGDRGALLTSAGYDEAIRFWDTSAVTSKPKLRGGLRIASPYAGMDITGATGLSDAQRAMLRALGAVERA